jgi:hypothetical protein
MVLQQQGFCLEKDWPFMMRNVDKEPPFHAFIEMSKRKWFYDERVIARGDSLCDTVRELGARYVPLGFGLTIDQGFVDWKPGDPPWKRRGPILGRHMVTYHAHDEDGMWIIGSYGVGNGKHNTVHVSWDAVGNDETYPVMAPRIDPKLVAEMMQ